MNYRNRAQRDKMNYLERAQYWELEANEWLSFIQKTELTPSEFNSAWKFLKRCDRYADGNRTQHRLL